MDVAASVGTAAAHVRKLIAGDVRAGAAAVVDFASTKAVSRSLKREALLVKFRQHEATSEHELEDIARQLLDLVQRIEDDHQEHWKDELIEVERQRFSVLHAQYLDKAEIAKPAFLGRGLGKRYPGSNFHLFGVDLELRLGEVTAVVGQNANGKTTLLRLVAGELRADEGTLEFPLLGSERQLDWAKVKATVAYLPQEIPPWHGNLQDNLRYEAALHGILGEDNEREVDFYITRLGLGEHLDKRWSQLSGGYKLRFALARILVWKPRLLILDEPLANLDVLAQSRLLQDLLDLARSPRYPLSILMSSQHLHELEAVASSITFLRDGNVEYSGSMAQIGDKRAYNQYELGTPLSNADALKEVFNDHRYEEPFHNGVSFVVKTGRETDAHTVLRKLLEADIEVNYFRDISRSIKSLFR